MLQFAVVFLVIALIAALLGYGGAVGPFYEGARTFFFFFLLLAVLSFLGHAFRRRPA